MAEECFIKEAKSYAELADLLLSRGMEADTDELILTLKRVSYYRLSGYLFPYRSMNDIFVDGTTLEKVLTDYSFDNELRILVFRIIGSIESFLKNRIMHVYITNEGPLKYHNRITFPNIDDFRYNDMYNSIYQSYLNSKEPFVTHFRTKYAGFHCFPLWMVFELISLGSAVRFFQGMHRHLQRKCFPELDVPLRVVVSWLRSVNYLRNLCAHHNRLWNRRLAVSPANPGTAAKYQQWYNPVRVFPEEGNLKVFSILSVLQYTYKLYLDPAGYCTPLRNLFSIYPHAMPNKMGFSADWQTCPIWNG
jgi:abortive infection bacteriophage resistance protein